MIPERISYLVSSAERVAVLEALSEGVTRQCDIARRCSVARSTVHRNLEGCRQRGWVRETPDGHVLTAAGASVLDAYDEFAATVETVTDHAAVLERFVADDEPPPLDALDGAETTVATRGDPHAPSVAAQRVIERNAGAPIRILVSGVSPITNEAGREALAADSSLETVVDHGVFRTLHASYADTVRAALDHPRFALHVCPPPIETGVVLAGEEVCLIVHDDAGGAHACLVGSDPDLRAWAWRRYDAARSSATRVESLAEPDLPEAATPDD